MDAEQREAPHDLGDGFRLRWSTAVDAERLAELIGVVYRGGPDEPPNAQDAAFVRRRMRGDYPLMTPDDFALVEETAPIGWPPAPAYGGSLPPRQGHAFRRTNAVISSNGGA